MSMSGSPQQQVKGREIPSKRFILNDLSQLPHDYSTTPGGSIFSTTPGGKSLCTNQFIRNIHSFKYTVAMNSYALCIY